MDHYPPEKVNAAIEQACREQNLELIWASHVHAFLAEDEDEWPACCGSTCEPCVMALGSVARRALTILEKG